MHARPDNAIIKKRWYGDWRYNNNHLHPLSTGGISLSVGCQLPVTSLAARYRSLPGIALIFTVPIAMALTGPLAVFQRL